VVEQSYQDRRRELAEPDWRRLPGWAGVTAAEWESAQWQRAHCVKNAQSVTPLVARAARAMLAAGVKDVCNQGVLLRGVNASASKLPDDLCFALLDGAGSMPYYFYTDGQQWWRAQARRPGLGAPETLTA
jgi:hypothetical protein